MIYIYPVAPIYKTGVRKQPHQTEYLESRKPKSLFKDVLDKEMSMGLGSKISVRV